MAPEILVTPNPKTDGVDHINVYSKGRTPIGRLLTNFAKTPFNHTDYGPFDSVEGLWYWLLTDKTSNELRYLSGFPAKRLGLEILRRNPTSVSSSDDDFILDVKEGIRCKLRQNKDILFQMAETTLPFIHYYWKGDINEPQITVPMRNDWIMEELESLRTQTKSWLNRKKRRP